MYNATAMRWTVGALIPGVFALLLLICGDPRFAPWASTIGYYCVGWLTGKHVVTPMARYALHGKWEAE